MFPEPFAIGPLNISAYGVMVALGLLAAIVLGGRENVRIRLMSPELFEKVALWTVLWGLIFARLVYVLTDLERFTQSPGEVIAIWQGGLVFYGGPVGAVVYLCWHFLVRRHGPTEGTQVTLKEGWVRLLRFFDLGAPFLALAHAFGRLGCLCAGCCFGLPHDGALALHYPEAAGAAHLPDGAGRYPIPLIESGFELLLFMWLMRLRLTKKFHGQVMLHWVMLYGAARFMLEMFRGDTIRGYLIDIATPGLNGVLGLDPDLHVMLTTSQFISIVIVVVAITLVFVGRRASADGPIEVVNYDPEEEEDDDDDDHDHEGFEDHDPEDHDPEASADDGEADDTRAD